jgi:predicted metal-dependent phosphotriesterase family hydrolase
MKRVRTILGDVPPEELGIVDAHDHLIRTGGLEVYLDKDFLMDDVGKAVQEAKSFAAAGGNAIVEMGTIALGRDIAKLLEVATQARIHIVAATGFHKSQWYDNRVHWVVKYSVEQIAELIAAEILEGIDTYDYMGPIVKRSPAKAGVIKVGTSYGRITPFEDKVLQAAALAQKKTGALISTHTDGGTMALEQVQLLTKYGASAERLQIGHTQRNPDPWYHKKVMSTGATMLYDGPYRIKYLPDVSRLNLIRDMLDAGFQKQICLGVDAGRSSYQKAYGGGVGIDYDLTVFVPRMREEGIPEDAIQDMIANNSARLLAIDV